MKINLPKLHSGQLPIQQSKSRFRIVAAGRRFGKSRLAALECIAEGVQGKRVWWLAPIYKQSEAAWRDLAQLARQIPGSRVVPSEQTITFGNGGFVVVRTANEPVTLRGDGLDFVVLDEAAFMEPEVWMDSIRPALSDRKGRALFISSPNGRNWYYELWQYAKRHPDEWATFHAPTAANPLIDPKEIQAAKDGMPPETFAQEYLAQFIKHSGMVYHEFAQTIHVTDKMPAHFETVFAGVDIGYRNPTALLLGGLDNDSRIWIFREEYRPQVVYEEWVAVAQQFQKLYDVAQWFVDPAAADFIGEMQSAGLPAQGAINDVLPGINTVKTRLLASVDGKPSLFIHPNCVNLIEELEVYQWMKNRDGLTDKVKKSKDHACDALRYLCVGAAGYNDNSVGAVYIAEQPYFGAW